MNVFQEMLKSKSKPQTHKVSATYMLGAGLFPPLPLPCYPSSPDLQEYLLPLRKVISWIFPSSGYISAFKVLLLSGLTSWLFDVHLPISHLLPSSPTSGWCSSWCLQTLSLKPSSHPPHFPHPPFSTATLSHHLMDQQVQQRTNI